jgi:ribonuclease HII
MITIGVDEVGRGPLAGPIVAAAATLPPECPLPEGITDSKKIQPAQRETLAKTLRETIPHAIWLIEADEIDRIGIEEANTRVLEEAAKKLIAQVAPNGEPVRILVDGRKKAFKEIQATFIVEGETAHKEIAAASILAKTFRDERMRTLDHLYPHLGLANHKGYGTKAHIRAIQTHGTCPLHRKSFLKNMSNTNNTGPQIHHKTAQEIPSNTP